MLHVLGVDKNLERAAMAVDNHVIDRKVNRVLAIGPFELVSRPFKRLGPLKRLGHIDDLAIGDVILGVFARRGLGRLRHRQNRPGDIIGPIGRAALAAGIPRPACRHP